MPCVGLGFGDVVISELLMTTTNPGKESDIDYSIGFMDPGFRYLALKIVSKLRQKGFYCDLSLKAENRKPILKNRTALAHATQYI